ncbi:phosphotransferase family protein [Baekduia soli]|uniref:Phosphotransferase family protein n=1 Tax=Baekduia soli TaxID=496014 RepID=A0A5B8UB51_9ACTN|nr:phosphotransferase family protein [Baekduia soli]QEC50413.1 phosphotransferase family protein [Baekduia soli]
MPDAGAELPGIDRAAVQDWLGRHVPGLEPPLEFRRVGRGRSNLTYRVSSAGGTTAVLRRPPVAGQVESAQDMGRERRVLECLAAVGQPVPRPLAHCTDIRVTGADFYVMEHVDGVVADSEQAVHDGLAPEARARVGASLARTLAGLHAVDHEAAGLADFGRGQDYAGRQLRRWSRQWELTHTRELPAVDRHAARLRDTVPPQDATSVVHGDYTTFNTILGPDGEVRAILDWELSTIGDPVADLAWLLMWWPDDQRSAPLGATPVSLMDGFAQRADVLEAYVAASGRDVEHLRWWLSLSYWKLAVILEGILYRWHQDPAMGGHDPGALEPGVEKLVGLAEETLAEGAR